MNNNESHNYHNIEISFTPVRKIPQNKHYRNPQSIFWNKILSKNTSEAHKDGTKLDNLFFLTNQKKLFRNKSGRQNTDMLKRECNFY